MRASSTSRRPSAAPARRGNPRPAPPQFNGKYLSLTTVTRDGTGIATPVWFVAEAGKILVITGAESHKVRRIHHNPAVTVADCTASGRLRSSPVPARAHILPDHQAPRARQLIARKYRLDKIVILPVYRAVQTIRHGRRHQTESVVLVITPAHNGLQAIVEAPLTQCRGRAARDRVPKNLPSPVIDANQPGRACRAVKDQNDSTCWRHLTTDPGVACRRGSRSFARR